MTAFWQLPGPSQKIREIVADISAGHNVALIEPRHLASGFDDALRSEITRRSLWTPRTIEIDAEPLRSLALACQLDPLRVPNVHSLVTHPRFLDQTLKIVIAAPEYWIPWRAFLKEFEDACRAVDPKQRTLLLVFHCGLPPTCIPEPATLLRVHDLRVSSDELDLHVFAASRSLAAATHPWMRELAVAVLAQLAVWDPEVVSAAATQPLDRLLEPVSWLREIARQRNWSGRGTADEQQIADAQRTLNGRVRTHSAWIAMNGSETVLRQRIWHAEMQVMFPLLAQVCQVLHRRYQSLFRTLPGVALELTHVVEQLRAVGSGSLKGVIEFASWLRDMRNDLAHLEPIPVRRLLAPQFQADFIEALSRRGD